MKSYTQSEYDHEVELQTKAARADIEARIDAEKKAEVLRRKELSDIGKAYDLVQECNEAICNNTSVEQFRNDCVIARLEADKSALQATIEASGKEPSRQALRTNI